MTKRTGIQLLKALFSAQLSGLVDFLTSFLLANVCHLYYVASTFLGALTGGVFNCCLNYRWVFRAAGCSKALVAIKYAMVWAGSIFFNTYGTYLLTEVMMRTAWAASLSAYGATNLFLLPKIIVALLVSLFWNFLLQRNFVYRNTAFDTFILLHCHHSK